MNEQKIHQLIRTELQKQYEQAKEKWLSDLSKKSFDIDWEPDWDELHVRVAKKVEKVNEEGVKYWLHLHYGSDYDVVLLGHVFQVWETMDFDLETTKDNLRTDGKPPVSLGDKMEHYECRY